MRNDVDMENYLRIGFIGAGKVGVTLGKYFKLRGKIIVGYNDIDDEVAKQAAEMTNTCVMSMEEILNECNMIFITVVDGAIAEVYNHITDFNLEGKIICHCSGAMSSEVFLDIDKHGAYGYSVHPLFACSSKEHSYRDIQKALFTIEGSEEKVNEVVKFISSLGNKVQVIDAKNKVKYHAAAVMASNQMIALISNACKLLEESGFTMENALDALEPLIRGNIDNIYSQGLVNALTGPVERNDITTIRKHLDVLDTDKQNMYKVLSRQLVALAETKNSCNNYTELRELLF